MTLHRRGIGTAEVEQLATKLCQKGKGRTSIVEIVMKNKIKDAHKEMRRLRYQNEKTWREEDDKLIREGILEGFLVMWHKEKMRWKKVLKEKRMKKIEWLTKKYKKKVPLPDDYQGYNFKDVPLGEEFTTEVPVYGGATISEDEKEALKLHPKFTTYEAIDTTQIMTEVEKSFTKVRWDRKNREKDQEESDSRTEREDWYNIEKNVIDMRKMAATDLPFNSRTYLPQALDESNEIEMHVVKQRVKRVTEEYRSKKKKSLRNLTEAQFKGIRSLRERRRNGEIVVYQSDKSAKMTVDTPDNYVESMKP